MNKQTRQYIERYFGVSVVLPRVPLSIRRKARAITQLVIDDPALTDGTLTFTRTYSIDPTAPDIRDIARHALVGNTSRQSKTLRSALGTNRSLPYDPIDSCDGVYTHSSWHQGDMIKTYWLGEVESILRHADITENEREKLLFQARKEGSQGNRVFAVGVSNTKHRVQTTPAAQSLTHIGLVMFRRELYPGTEYAVEQLHAHNITLILASSESPMNTTMLAHLTCLVPATIVSKDAAHGTMTVHDRVIGGFDIASRKRFCQRFDTDKTLFVDEPLTDFWRQLQSIR